MKSLRRYFTEGNTYFLTHVTYNRKPILIENIDLLWSAIEKHKTKKDFNLIALAILPDHWHCIIDPLGNDPADLMKRIKLSFAMTLLKRLGLGSGRTWQNRYWDHIIRDQRDLNHHLDYTHYNPVKHGIVRRLVDYEHSSFKLFVERELYGPDWGAHGVSITRESMECERPEMRCRDHESSTYRTVAKIP